MPKKQVNLQLNKLSDGERLWYVRKYIYYYNQYEMAEHTGCGHNMYCEIELGRRPLVGSWNTVPELKIFPWKAVSIGAKIAIARRRSGLGLVRVAKKLGVSRMWYLTMEHVGDNRVVAFWAAQGFKGF